ncbi:heme-binding protein [soil metagenome]
MKAEKIDIPLVDRLKGIPGVFGIRLGEEARYEVLKVDGAFEIRQYDDLVVATTNVVGNFRRASEEGFMRLAGYIFGHNHTHENFPMTRPVLQNPERRKISMTTPVLQNQEAGGWTMSFVLPTTEKFSAAPHPDDDRVKLRPVASQCWAVLRYTGRTDEKEMRLKERELREWISDNASLKPTDDVRWAQYDGPMTIPFLRKNEVQIRVEAETRFQ